MERIWIKINYLLQQIIKLGGKKYDNLEPVLDMVQDIQIPNHNDHDKELAGIPSALTNIIIPFNFMYVFFYIRHIIF